MAVYLVQKNKEVPGAALYGGFDSMVVEADSAANARNAVAARFGGSPDADSMWQDTNAVSVTEITAAADLENWTFRIKLYSPNQRLPVETVEVVGGAADAPDDLANAMVTALNATGTIGNASYDATGNVLTVAGGADSVGDHQIAVDYIPPWGEESYTPFVGAITDGGAAGDAITLDMPADVVAIPTVAYELKSR